MRGAKAAYARTVSLGAWGYAGDAGLTGVKLLEMRNLGQIRLQGV